MNKLAALAGLPVLFVALSATAEEITVNMNKIDANGVGASVGTVTFTDTPKGLAVVAKLKDVPAGQHGFHVHQNPDCGAKEKDGKLVAGLAAGGHYDPSNAGKHAGPNGQGHIGDLPALEISANGTVAKMEPAAHVKVADLKGRAIVIHDGGDNYADEPKPLGGGGARIACGVVK
jgi:Cu-Zn family superoxide dismutase